MTITSNSKFVAQHIQNISGKKAHLQSACNVKGVDKGRTNYDEYNAAVTANKDLGSAVKTFIEDLEEDCRKVKEIARHFDEFDADLASKIMIPSSYIPTINKRK